MAQQTAVEWLIQQVNSEQYQIAFGQTYISIDLIEQAKAMEKQQIEIAFSKSYLIGLAEVNYDDVNKAAEQYYNKTYKK